MDDYRRALYMQVLNHLKQRLKQRGAVHSYLCLELTNALHKQQHPDTAEYMGNAPSVMQEFFPELKALFDTTYWGPTGFSNSAKIGESWWDPYWVQPRIRALECILRD